MQAVVGETRALNMQKRRTRILEAARRAIGEDGYDAMTLRGLAKAAGITVPTIYNLIGNKEQVLVALCLETLSEVENRIEGYEDEGLLGLVTAIVTESTRLFASDEPYYRATFVALDRLEQSGEYADDIQRFHRLVADLPERACARGRAQGQLRGDIPAEVLAAHMVRSYRMGGQAWSARLISLETFHDMVSTDLLVSLAADAADPFRQEIVDEIRKLTKKGGNKPVDLPI